MVLVEFVGVTAVEFDGIMVEFVGVTVEFVTRTGNVYGETTSHIPAPIMASAIRIKTTCQAPISGLLVRL